jgi:hypothetical protein
MFVYNIQQFYGKKQDKSGKFGVGIGFTLRRGGAISNFTQRRKGAKNEI